MPNLQGKATRTVHGHVFSTQAGIPSLLLYAAPQQAARAAPKSPLLALGINPFLKVLRDFVNLWLTVPENVAKTRTL